MVAPPKPDELALWGSVCSDCGTVTQGSTICDQCGTNVRTIGLWERTDPNADIAADLADEHEPIHAWFNLTYANYLVLPRSILQSMPVAWQRRFVQCLRELQEAAWDVPQAFGYRVNAVDERGKFMKDPVPHYNRGRTHVELRLAE